MCKLTDDGYNVISSFQLSGWNGGLLSIPSYGAALIASFDVKSGTDYTITVPTVTAEWYGTLGRLDFVITDGNNSSNIIKHRNSYGDLSQWETTVSSSESSGKTKLGVGIFANGTGVGTYIYCGTTNVSYTETLYKSGTSLPYRDLVGLGSLCGITILGDHIDGERIDHGNGGGDVFDYIRNHTFGNGIELSANQEYTMQSDGYVKGTAYTYNGGGYFTIGSIEHSITGGNFGSGYHPTIYLKAYKGEVVKLLYKTNVNLYVYEQTD